MPSNPLIHCLLTLLLMTSHCRAYDDQGIVFRDSNDDEGKCSTRDGGVGECRELTSCPAVQNTFKRVPPTICSFKGFTPIVCCPQTPEERERQPQPTSTEPSLLLPPAVDFECGWRKGRRMPATRGQVVGGKEARRNSWPWMAAVGRLEWEGRVKWFCDGVFITPEFVLSAAHCPTYSSVDVVRLGGHNLKIRRAAGQVDARVAEVALHPLYRPPSFAHDLALLRLATPVTLTTKVLPVCLPWAKGVPSLDGRRLTVTGWGATSVGSGMSDVLRQVAVTVFPTFQCDAFYNTSYDYNFRFPNGVTSDFLCAGDRRGGKDACRGDSGGPLVYNTFGRYILAGVVTGGRGCGGKNSPGIYAAVGPHLQWIRDVAFSNISHNRS